MIAPGADQAGRPQDGLTAAVDILIRCATAGYAAFTLLMLAARVWGLRFSTVVVLWAVIGAAVVGAIVWNWARLSRRFDRGSAMVGLALVVLLGASGWLAGAINAPEEDDSFYVPPAIQSLAHPDRPMGFELGWIAPFPSGVPLRTDFGLTSNVVEILWACVSYVSGVSYLTLYQVGGSCLFAAALLLAYFWLFSRLTRSPAASLVGTLAVGLAAFLLFREHDLGFGILMSKIWLGKCILLTLVVPVVAGFAFDFAFAPSVRTWTWLAVSTVAACGFSSSALSMIPVLLAALSPGAFALSWLRGERFARRVLLAAALPAAGAYVVVTALVYYVRLGQDLARHESVSMASSAEIFNSGFATYVGSWTSLTAVLVLGSFCYLFARRRSVYLPVLLWFVAMAVAFTNPWVAGLVARHVTSVTVYGRIFHMLPVYALVGLAAADIATVMPGRVGRPALAAVLIAACAAYAYHLGPETLTRRLDVDKMRVLGSPSFGVPAVRIDPALVSDVEEIARVLPPGNTLSSLDYNLAFPMLSAQYPQYYLWPIDIITFFGDTQGFAADANLRYQSARYLMGNEPFRGEFEQLLATSVQNVVLSTRFGVPIIPGARAILVSQGFEQLAETPRYLLFTRPVGR